jgi:hypothetical protein
MPDTIPHIRNREPGEPLTAEALKALVWLENANEPWVIIQEKRLLNLEHAVVSRKARRRLRRELRASAARFARVGGFTAARMEDVGNQALCWPERENEAAA